MADLPTLRAKVEAAQALAAKATRGPYLVVLSDNATPFIMHNGGGDWTDYNDEDSVVVALPARYQNALANAKMLAAAPDLVTYLTDALALAESQASELTAIRVALGNGADEAAWPPGLTLAEAVGRLRELVNMASGFEISEPTVAARSLGGVRVERCGQLEGPDLWAVRHRGNVLGRDGHWAYEPIPSSRDDAFMAEYRFASRDEAIKAGRAAIAGAQ